MPFLFVVKKSQFLEHIIESDPRTKYGRTEHTEGRTNMRLTDSYMWESVREKLSARSNERKKYIYRIYLLISFLIHEYWGVKPNGS